MSKDTTFLRQKEPAKVEMLSGCLYRKLFETFPTGGKLEAEPGLAGEIIFDSWPGNTLEFPLDELEVLAGDEVVWGFPLKLLLSQHGLIKETEGG